MAALGPALMLGDPLLVRTRTLHSGLTRTSEVKCSVVSEGECDLSVVGGA